MTTTKKKKKATVKHYIDVTHLITHIYHFEIVLATFSAPYCGLTVEKFTAFNTTATLV